MVHVSDNDGLTGAGTRSALWSRINHEMFTREPTRFTARYLCVDVDNFKAFLDINGLGAGDDALIKLAHSLSEHYGAESVFRVGGDDFVIELGARAAWLPTLEGLPIKHAILEVAVRRNEARNHHVCKWIMMNLDAASLAARAGGVTLPCGDPPSLAP